VDDNSDMTLQRSGLLILAVLILATAAWVMYQAVGNRCVSRERGLRGEVMRGANGTYLYFNGECWTTRPVAPTDTAN
jgi:hypothetical protein